MNDTPELQTPSSYASPQGRRAVLGRLLRLMRKELREILRDRRTIITLVVMPLFVYPLLALAFQRFLITSLQVGGDVQYVIGFESEKDAALFVRQLGVGGKSLERREQALPRQRPSGEAIDSRSDDWQTRERGSQDDLQSPKFQWLLIPPGTSDHCVEDATVDLAVVLQRHAQEAAESGLSIPTSWQLVFRTGSPSSESLLQFVEARLRAYNDTHLDEQLKSLGVLAALSATTQRHAVSSAGAPAFSLAALIPLILILTTVTGAVYPAIDLTAGERERGTLETLIAAPVPRVGLLLAKYVAVLTVALLTAIINLTAMTITAESTGLSASIFGDAGMTGSAIVKVLLLLALFAAFFSAILLAITSYARSFKEAQAYIIPLMLLCLVPGIICLTPTLQASGLLAVTPLVNIVILARDVLEGSVDPTLATAAVFSTILYIAAAIAWAARIFGTDAVLYGSQATWADLVRRPVDSQPAASLPAALFCLALMFPCYFVLSARLARSPNVSMDQRLVLGGLITALVFGAIPWSVVAFARVRLGREGYFNRAATLGLLASALLGVSLWPFAHEIFLLNDWIGLTSLESEHLAAVKDLLDQWRHVSPAMILVMLALAPGIFEEFFFRGVFFTSLRTVLTPGRTIVVTAVLFGLFHVVAATVLAPERFLPSAFLGLVLGWVRVRTGSVLPCMVLHTLHNALLLSVVYWRDELAAHGIGVQETTHLPAGWLLAATVGVGAAVALMLLATKPPPTPAPAVPVT
jgi:sodium transport system permease protein